MIPLVPAQLAEYTCSRPFYQLLLEAASGDLTALFNWPLCPYTITGLGLTGVGMIVLATGFVGLKNWSEGWTLPMTWLALIGPTMAAAMLPGNIIRRMTGFIVLAVAMCVIGAWWWWGRS